MKSILKFTIALFLSLFIVSCSKDDGPKKENYPTKITSTTPASSIVNTTTIEYDSKNRISQIVFENSSETNSLVVTYNSDNLISKVDKTKTTSTTTEIRTFNYNYTNKILSQIVIQNGTSSTPIDIFYNEETNTYTLDDSPTTPDYFTYDSNDNLKELYFGGITMSINYNSNQGIYNGINFSFPLYLSTLYSSLDAAIGYSHFFANQEITDYTFGPNAINSTVVRNENNTISLSVLKNASTNEVLFSSTIEYELR